jgi:hypothetical protein
VPGSITLRLGSGGVDAVAGADEAVVAVAADLLAAVFDEGLDIALVVG